MAQQWVSQTESNVFNQVGGYSMVQHIPNLQNQEDEKIQDLEDHAIQESVFPPGCPPNFILGAYDQFLDEEKDTKEDTKEDKLNGFGSIKEAETVHAENNNNNSNLVADGVDSMYFSEWKEQDQDGVDDDNNNEFKVDENIQDQTNELFNKIDDTNENKIEEDQMKQEPSVTQEGQTALIGVVKRGRGRPRKYPLIVPPPAITDENGQLIPVEEQEDYEAQKRIREAEWRRKHKEEMKKKSQEMVSDEEDSEENAQFNEKNFVPNSQFLKNYRQKLIGRSSNSKIFELKDPGSDRQIGEVVKLVPHKMCYLHQSECTELRNEFKFLKKMDHPHIISLGSTKELIRDRNFCGIILPQAECNLMQYAKNYRHGKISLSVIRHAFRQIAQAISYLHDNYISHNDIKPDNMFMYSDTDYKLADFGFSVDLPKPNAFKHNSSSSLTLRKQVKIEDLKKNWKQRNKQYVAPELIKLLIGKRPRSASDEKACDVFALGVSFFIIVFYQLPFCGKALPTDQRYKYFFKENYDKFWQQFSSMFAKFDLQENSHSAELKDLFNKMLCSNPQKRATIEEILEHPWLQH